MIFTAVMQDPESPLVALQGRCRNWTKLQDKKSTTAVPLQMFHNCFKIGKLYLNMGKNFPSLLLSPTDMALMAAAVSVSLGWRGEEEGEEGWRNWVGEKQSTLWINVYGLFVLTGSSQGSQLFT